MHHSDLRGGTVPVSGLQYTTSPSLPTALKAINPGRDPSPPATARGTFPTANSSVHHSNTISGFTHDALPQSTFDLYERYYASLPGTEPARRGETLHSSAGGRNAGAPPSTWSASLTLPDALSSIGPSARRLLQLDAVQRQDAARHGSGAAAAGEQGGDARAAKRAADRLGNWGTLTTQPVARAPAISAAARTLPLYTGKTKSHAVSLASSSSQSAQGPRTAGNAPKGRALPAVGAAAAATSNTAPPLQSSPLTLKRASQAYATVDLRPSMLSSTIMNGSPLGNSAAAQAWESVAPPLVTELHSYIRRELIRSTSSGAPAPSALDQLGPYRESFRALSSAFPAYASLMSDIQSAYDNVIQAQAELLTDAYAAMTVSEVERTSNQELVASLHEQVSTISTELKEMEAALASRAVTEEEEMQHTVRQRPRSAQLSDAIELRRELDSAHQRIGDLERSSQSDLEKIVILIGAVRECDRRLKEYERIVASVTGQVSELDEFKRIAGEAQAELQGFRKRYADYVPVTDFQLMKDYLAAELEASQMQTRRWRRTAAVRGTQLDVMQRRLANLEEERQQLLKAVEEGGETATTAAPGQHPARGLLTPRPSWGKLHDELPELREYAADVGLLTTVDDHREDMSTTAIGSETSAPSRAKAMPMVKGMKETALQVDYLVRRVRSLEGQLKTQQALRLASVQVNESSSFTPHAGSVAGNNAPLIALENTEAKEGGAAAKGALTKGDAAGPQRRVSRRGQYRPSEGFQGSPTMSHPFSSSAAGGAGNALAAAPPLELPLIGLGYGSDIPVYLRASGVLPRRPVAPSTIVALVYHFFLDVLPPYMDARDQLQRREEEEATTTSATTAPGNRAGGGGTTAIGVCLRDFLQSEMTTRDDLRGFSSVAHLVMNLMKDSESHAWYADALHVLLWTVQGVLPPRVAVDAAVVVAQVKRDVRALAKEMQSSRLRRQALGECLQPVLELKSPAELAELRAALGSETTFSVDTLCSDAHPFMEVLLVQECRSSAELYISFLSALSARATAMASRVTSANTRLIGMRSVSAAAPPPPQLEPGDRVVTLSDVAAAIQEVEPLTPEVVVRELSVNAAAAAAGGRLDSAPASGSGGGAAGASTSVAEGGAAASKRTASVEEGSVVVRLSDIVRAIAAAPLIRRTAQNSSENCAL